MAKSQYYLVCYDVVEPKRWRKVYKVMNAFGERIQYSVFKCRLSQKQLAELRHKLVKIMSANEDRLLIAPIHPEEVDKIFILNMVTSWEDPDQQSYLLV